MSSAEILREAAELIRSRATEAPLPAGPWETEFSDVIRTDIPFGSPGYLIVECATLPEAKHIASWHPTVALAVADWLDRIAWTWKMDSALMDRVGGEEALTVANAYLGRTS